MLNIMRAEIISTEIIRPSSPTPNSHRFYKLSLVDKINPRIYVPIILFYQNHDPDHSVDDDFADRTCSGLKKSLSETLTRYYPLAGRIKDGLHIECNDEGVDFIVARVDYHLEGFLRRPELEALSQLFEPPADLSSSILAVQITFFQCGGMAVTASMSHKVGDLSSLSTFVNDWASMARRSGDQEISADFIPSFFPPNDSLINIPQYELPKGNCITRRFVFSGAKLHALKALAVSYGVENPTRVQVVTALIYKSAIAASSLTSNSDSGRSSILFQVVNFRGIVIPPFPDKSFGNMALNFAVSSAAAEEKESQVEFHGMVSLLKEGISHLRRVFGRSFTGEGLSSQIFEYVKEGYSLSGGKAANHMVPLKYLCSSWCRFPLYKADFGWGKPIWVSSPLGVRNTWIMMDTRNGDGIEALVSLEEQDMTAFEQDREFLQFASLNPSALDTN